MNVQSMTLLDFSKLKYSAVSAIVFLLILSKSYL
jgi:hypothetical protein